MILIDKNTKILVDIVDTTEEVINGLLVIKGTDKYIYASCIELEIFDIEPPQGIEIQKYMYIDGEFVEVPEV
ncbi:MAG TPA: hypothetical protein PK566_15385 [Pseudobacteroides sp.]|nr:hypothetical protein [Pseudobacteroides sp.]